MNDHGGERPIPPHLLAAFRNTVIEFDDPSIATHTDALSAFGSPLFVITAHNPHGLDLDVESNAQRNRELYESLSEETTLIAHCVGRAKDGDHAEASLAVAGIGFDRAKAIGRRWGQLAIFEITTHSMRVHSCTTNRSWPVDPQA